MELQIQNLSKTYPNGVHALNDVSLTIPRGMFGLLGPNGAGKSTTVKAISGLILPRSGRVALEGKDLAGLPPHDIVHLGVAHAPEGRRIFNRLTVHENLEMGAYLRSDARIKGDDPPREAPSSTGPPTSVPLAPSAPASSQPGSTWSRNVAAPPKARVPAPVAGS